MENTPKLMQSKGSQTAWDEVRRAAGDAFFAADFSKAQTVRGPQALAPPTPHHTARFLHSGTEKLTLFHFLEVTGFQTPPPPRPPVPIPSFLCHCISGMASFYIINPAFHESLSQYQNVEYTPGPGV